MTAHLVQWLATRLASRVSFPVGAHAYLLAIESNFNHASTPPHTFMTHTFKRLGWNLHFSAWFMKNVLYEQKKIKLRNNQHLWKIKEIMQHVLKMQETSLLPKYIK
jgi:hypothetical protein